MQLGELRRRQGRFDEAEALFAQAEFHPLAITGIAQLRLASGDTASAWAAIRGLLEWLPQNSRIVRADVLYLAVIIAHAAAKTEQAQETGKVKVEEEEHPEDEESESISESVEETA